MTGGPDLKGSQHYPILFGRSVAEVVCNQQGEIIKAVMARRPAVVDHATLCNSLSQDPYIYIYRFNSLSRGCLTIV